MSARFELLNLKLFKKLLSFFKGSKTDENIIFHFHSPTEVFMEGGLDQCVISILCSIGHLLEHVSQKKPFKPTKILFSAQALISALTIYCESLSKEGTRCKKFLQIKDDTQMLILAVDHNGKVIQSARIKAFETEKEEEVSEAVKEVQEARKPQRTVFNNFLAEYPLVVHVQDTELSKSFSGKSKGSSFVFTISSEGREIGTSFEDEEGITEHQRQMSITEESRERLTDNTTYTITSYVSEKLKKMVTILSTLKMEEEEENEPRGKKRKQQEEEEGDEEEVSTESTKRKLLELKFPARANHPLLISYHYGEDFFVKLFAAPSDN
jgi:hypothetical protein